MVLKTREKLIEVARQLFVRKGLENTTMNDIANASDKGRRTIYTYFKNKREIYNAVLERESEHIVSRLRDIVEDNTLLPEEKLRRYLDARIKTHTETAGAHEGSLLTRITRDMRRTDRLRRMALTKETEFLQRIVDEGIATNVFDADQCKRLLGIQSTLFQGVEYSNIKGHSATDSDNINTLVDFLITAVLKR